MTFCTPHKRNPVFFLNLNRYNVLQAQIDETDEPIHFRHYSTVVAKKYELPLKGNGPDRNIVAKCLYLAK